MRGQFSLLSDGELRQLSGAAFDLLGRVGMKVEHEEILAALARLGCQVDEAAFHVSFPSHVLEATLRHYGEGPVEQYEVEPPGEDASWSLIGGVQPHFLDWPAGRRRLATREDLLRLVKMAHVLPEFRAVGLPLVDCTAPQEIEPILSRALVMKHTDKPFAGSEVIHASNVKYLVELADIEAEGKARNTGVATCNFVIAPLRMARRACECVVEKFRFDIPFIAGTMPISGLSAPGTVAGTAAVALAEVLGCFVVARALRPDLPVGAIVASGSLDMRTARACFGSPEATLQDVACSQVAHRIWGVRRVGPAYGYIDAKTPGIQATYEKLFKMLIAFPFTGNIGGWEGLLSAGQDYCPTQHMLDGEIASSIHRFKRGIEVNAETLALEVVEEVGLGSGKSFLEHDHTAAHARSEFWMPELLERTRWRGEAEELAAERELLERADAKWRAAVERYEPPDIPAEKLRAIDEVVERARRDLLGS